MYVFYQNIFVNIQDVHYNKTTNIQLSIQNENKEEEQPQPFITQQHLGGTVGDEISNRLRHSKKAENGTYYCFCDQLFNRVHPQTIISCIKELLCDPEQTDVLIEMICVWITEFLIGSTQTMDDRDLIKTIGANIMVEMQNPTIFFQFPIKKIAIIKLVKVEKQPGLYCKDNIYMYIYLCRHMVFPHIHI